MSVSSYSFCFLVNRNGRVLLLRRSSTCRNRAGEWDLPGGSADDQETAELTARRELVEETGRSVEELQSLSSLEFSWQGAEYSFNYFQGHLDDNPILSYEHDSFNWFALEEIQDKLVFPPHRQAAGKFFDEAVASRPV